MFLNSIKIHFFRNFSQINLGGFRQNNFIIGPNGSGKTNLIEALSILSSTRPLRKVHYQDLIQWNKDYFYLKGDYKEAEIELSFDGHHKHLKWNGEHLPLLQLETKNPSVAFLPGDLNILTGVPILRRGFLNTALSKISPTYRPALHYYNRVLKQRNSQLKLNPSQARLWNKELIRRGAEIIRNRSHLCRILSQELSETYETLYQLPVELKYRSNIPLEETIEENFQKRLFESQKVELYSKHTLCGPHRDDFEILAEQRSSNLFASQGQTRALFIALKLSIAKLVQKQTGTAPLLLVDDALLELDEPRRKIILEKFNAYQTLITLTSDRWISDFPRDSRIYDLKDGVFQHR